MSAKDESVANTDSVAVGVDSSVNEKKENDGASEKVNDIEMQTISPTEPLPSNPNWLQDGDIGALRNMLQQRSYLYRGFDIPVEFHNLTFTMKVDMERKIPTVLTMLSSMFCWWQHFQEKKTVHILDNVTGRIPARKMSLLIGPPGAGKSGKLVDVHCMLPLLMNVFLMWFCSSSTPSTCWKTLSCW